MPLSQSVTFLYNTQLTGLSVDRTNLEGVLVLNALITWVHRDKLNKLKTFSVTIDKNTVDLSKIFLERNVYIPGFEFRGIITGLTDVNDSILKITMQETGWHTTRRIYQIEDTFKEYNIVATHKTDFPQLITNTLRTMNDDMPIIKQGIIGNLVSLWKLDGTPDDAKLLMMEHGQALLLM